MLPLTFLLSRRGRGLDSCSPCMEDEEDEVVDVGADEADEGIAFVVVGAATAGMAFVNDAGNVIFGLTVLY